MSHLITDIKTEDQLKEIISTQQSNLLLKFYAPWCNPSQKAKPIIDDLAEKYKDELDVVTIDIDNNQAIKDRYRVKGVPTVISIKNGDICNMQVGLAEKKVYEDIILEIIKKR